MNCNGIRRLVVEALPRVGLTASAPRGEAVVVRQGREVGRSFYFNTFRAVWREDARRIEFYQDRGKRFLVVNVEPDVQAKAA